MNNKTTYAYNKQMHDEAVERCQSNKELYDFAQHLFTNLTEKHEDWNEFATFYNHDVVEYVQYMFNTDIDNFSKSYDSNDIEAVVEQLYDFLDDWNVNWFNEDYIERIKHDPASLLVAKNIVTKLTKEPGTYEQFQAEFYGDVNAYCQQFIKDNNLEGVDVDAITEYVYDKLDEWDGFVI